MNSTEFLTIAYSNRKKLNTTITRYIVKRTKSRSNRLSISDEELEDLVTEVIIKTGERLSAGVELDLDTEAKIHSFLAVACFNSYNNLTKKKAFRAKFNAAEYTNEYYDDLEVTPILQTTSSEIYTQTFQYVYDNFSFLEAGLFKAYTINRLSADLQGEKKFTLQKLSEMSGYSINKCQSIIQKIKDDLKSKKDTFLKYDIKED